MKALLILAAAAIPCFAAATSIPLAGTWRFRLDPQNTGISQQWGSHPLSDESLIYLPGSTDQAGYGTKTRGPEKGWLSRVTSYIGPAWYQRDITIPESWRGKRIVLFLERCHWQTHVWVDDQGFDTQDSLATPHVHDLTRSLTPGKHRLTLLVDNTYRVDVGVNAHSVTEHTQTNWNGVVGAIALRASDPVWIDRTDIYTDVKNSQVRAAITVKNTTGQPVSGELTAAAAGTSSTRTFRVEGTESRTEIVLSMGKDVRLWNVLDPALYPLDLKLSASAGSRQWGDSVQQMFGMREIATRANEFILNGNPVFLRGTLECNIFPLTGYPPTDVESWDRLFRIARSYGLNHFRFHSATPPEAAFDAADRAGFLLQIELPVWNHEVGQGKPIDAYMRAEGYRVLATYGNHPSFTMLCLGNELNGNFAFTDDLVAEFKRADPRRLYTFSSDYVRRVPGATSDYYVTHRTAAGPVRIHGARFETTQPGTDFDFTDRIRPFTIPTVAHELGQWVTFPSYRELGRYTGVLKPRNLEAFREQLAARGMIDEADLFQQASGRFAWTLYKEDIEAALRTPHFGGVQLLQLQDFPGQGEALVGLLDSFWESKGILEPEQMRRFFSDTVPLLRFSKFVWTNDETFEAKAQVAHYGKSPQPGALSHWTIRDDSGAEIAGGRFDRANLVPGEIASLGDIKVPLGAVKRAAHLKVTVALDGSTVANDWDLWVYPRQMSAKPPGDVIITQRADEARNALARGRKVLYLWPAKQKGESVLPNRFLTVFWSLSWFKSQPGTLGILCDPAHPALAEFPTQMHSNYQWWELTEGSAAFILDDTPANFRPVVQVIDDFHRNHKLGAVFEAKVAEGKLLACALDLTSDLDHRPAARQLLYSLSQYMQSAAFAPRSSLDTALIDRLLQPGN